MSIGMPDHGGIHYVSIEWNGMVARLHGDVDWTNADVLLDEIAAHGPCVIDLELVTFIDDAGKRALLALHEEHECVVLNQPPGPSGEGLP